MTLILLGQAGSEFIDSAEFYESKEAGLGIRFRDEIAAAMGSIERHPEPPPLRVKGYRRINLRVFPHYIAYVIRSETIWVVAIAHSRKRPEYWIGRMTAL